MIRAKKQYGEHAYRLGLQAEALCRWALRFKFYRIVAARYKTGQGEIDLVVARGRTLAFVEIKARADEDRVLEAVQERQRVRIARAANVFLARNPQFNGFSLRFDIMTVVPRRWPRHIENAFEGQG